MLNKNFDKLPIAMLFVDDEQAILDLIQISFRRELSEGQVKIYFSNSVDDALVFLNTDPGKEVLILVTDINMPVKSGLELLAELLEDQYRHIIKYISSAYDHSDFIEESKKFEIQKFFTKPLQLNELKNKFKEDLGHLGIEVKFHYK